MNNMKRWRRLLFILFVCCFSLIGCARTKIIDKSSIVHIFGFDQAKNGDVIGVALVPDYTASKEGDQIQYLEEQSITGALLGPSMATYTSTPVELAKIDVLLFGENYAKSGIYGMVERFILNPQIGTNVQVALSTESAKKTLNAFKKEKSFNLAERIQHNMEGQALPNMNLHIFFNRFYGEGMDAYAPLLTLDEKDKVKVDGIGIFKGDKLKLQLDLQQTSLFSLIENKQTKLTYKIELEENNPREIVTFRAFQSKSRWDWERKKGKMDLRLMLEVTIIEYPDQTNEKKTEDVMKLKKVVEERLEKEVNNLLKTFKEHEVDPLGLGNIARSKDRNWEKDSFYDRYRTMPIDVKVNVKILHSGLEG